MVFLARAALESDVSRIVSIERAVETAPHWGEQEYLQIVRGTSPLRRCLIVAEMAGQVVGFAVGKVLAEAGELESVAVCREARRQGIGAELCRAVLAWCRESGADSVELEVRAASLNVRELYRKLGFAEIGQRRGYYEAPVDDAILMKAYLVGQ